MREHVHVQMLYDLRDVNKIFILIRPKKKMAPQARANKEIASSPIFARLRAEMGDDFDAYFRSKVVALAGDINKDYMVRPFLSVLLSCRLTSVASLLRQSQVDRIRRAAPCQLRSSAARVGDTWAQNCACHEG